MGFIKGQDRLRKLEITLQCQIGTEMKVRGSTRNQEGYRNRDSKACPFFLF